MNTTISWTFTLGFTDFTIPTDSSPEQSPPLSPNPETSIGGVGGYKLTSAHISLPDIPSNGECGTQGVNVWDLQRPNLKVVYPVETKQYVFVPFPPLLFFSPTLSQLQSLKSLNNLEIQNWSKIMYLDRCPTRILPSSVFLLPSIRLLSLHQRLSYFIPSRFQFSVNTQPSIFLNTIASSHPLSVPLSPYPSLLTPRILPSSPPSPSPYKPTSRNTPLSPSSSHTEETNTQDQPLPSPTHRPIFWETTRTRTRKDLSTKVLGRHSRCWILPRLTNGSRTSTTRGSTACAVIPVFCIEGCRCI